MPFTPNSPEQYWMPFIASSAFKINRRIALKSGGALLWNLGDGQSLDGSSVLLYVNTSYGWTETAGKFTAIIQHGIDPVLFRRGKVRGARQGPGDRQSSHSSARVESLHVRFISCEQASKNGNTQGRDEDLDDPSDKQNGISRAVRILN